MCNEFIKIDKVLVQYIEASYNILSLLVTHAIFELKYKALHFDHTIEILVRISIRIRIASIDCADL